MQMDTPADVAARVRFGKFRGLRSWRTSPWDPKENLPREYARVFAFQNPTRAQKRWAFSDALKYCMARLFWRSRSKSCNAVVKGSLPIAFQKHCQSSGQ